ncbi:MAG: UDP-N-acetyl glucosamine 2-epimerase [Candidatus Xenobia bacterium]
MTVFGTRPEAIKMAPVVLALAADPRVRVTNVVTGQHREMLDQVMQLFGISPDVDLNIMQPGQTLSAITTRTLEGLEPVLRQHQPDVVLVQGDTTTAFAAGLAAFYHKIPVGHVEAGLRTDDRYDPFPEEINRRLLTTLCEMHFPPTHTSYSILRNLDVCQSRIHLTGNTVIDALHRILAETPPGLPGDLQGISAESRILLVETHRRENLGKPMQDICEALRTLVKKFTNTVLVFSVHKNPQVREVVFPALEGLERTYLLEPVDYPVLLRLMRESTLILTDSGGIQEEAPALGKPVLVLRRTTERPEGIEAGVSRLVGTDPALIVEEASRLLTDPEEYRKMSQVANPYGDGRASERIVQAVLHRFGHLPERPPDFVYAPSGSELGATLK